MNERGWQCFLDLCLQAKNKEQLTDLFNLIFTPDEKDSIETRCLIVQSLLEQKESQREIAKSLNVSIAKITRGSNELKRISPVLKDYLQKVLLGV